MPRTATALNGHKSSKEPCLNQGNLVQRCRVQQFSHRTHLKIIFLHLKLKKKINTNDQN